ncbi:MAG: LPS export ABC transporter permease LptG [Alphaproteobacteria bacterium]|nr:LPS export ABC transporter permease LptG [Alphaproteobacteria bacterium]
MSRLAKSRFSVPVLSEYVAKMFFMRFLVLLIGLAVVLQTLDLLSQSGDILAAEGADNSSIWRFTLLRMPQMMSNVVAFSALLATLITSASLAQHSEITVMKSTGLSALRIILPMMGVCLLISIVHFAFNELVVVQTNDEYERWRAADFAVGERILPPVQQDAWASENSVTVRIQDVTREGTILDEVSLYDRKEDGTLRSLTQAKFAAHVNGKWTLFDVRRFDVEANTFTSTSQEAWDTQIPPERFQALSIDPETVGIGRLADAVTLLAGEGRTIARLSVWLHHKISGPLGTILMPLLGSLVAFGLVRSGNLFIRAVAGMAFGFSYFVVDSLLLAVGQFGTVPPAFAAWAPFFLFLLLGLTVLVYAEE